MEAESEIISAKRKVYKWTTVHINEQLLIKMNKIIEFFLENPEKEYYIRQLSRMFKKSPTTISKVLKDYQKQEILTSEKKLNHLLFKANIASKKFKTMKINYNLNTIMNSSLIELIQKEYNPKAIVLFGSFAKGENIPTSDIDLLVISSVKKDINLEIYENKLKHKIQLFVKSDKDTEDMKTKSKELLNSFINGITLYGLFEVFK